MRIVPTTDRTSGPGLGRPVARPQVLPFDDGADEAVPYLLTAAAHREVLGREVPPLTSVATGSTRERDDEVVDTRRVQARALLRSGMPMATIAAALGVEIVRVEEWTADLGDELARRRRRSGRRTAAPAVAAQGAPAPSQHVPGRTRAVLVPGLAFALARIDGDTVTLLHDEVEPVAILLDALRAANPRAPLRPRVAVRLASGLAADRTRTSLAERLGVDPASITVGHADRGTQHGLELRIDVLDADAARIVRRWREGQASGLRGWDSNPQTFRLTADCSAS